MKLEFSRQIFEKYSNIKFHENPYSGSRVVRADGRTDMTKLIVSFHIFANSSKKYKTRSCLRFIKHHNVKENGRLAGCLHVFCPSSPDKGGGSSWHNGSFTYRGRSL